MVALRINYSSCFARVGNYLFSDVSDFNKAIHASHILKATQLRIQPLKCQHTILDYGYAQFSFLSLNVPILLTGQGLANQVTLGCALYPHKASMILQKNVISSEMLFGLNADQSFQIMLPAGTVLCIFQVPRHFFEKKLPQHDCQALANQLSKTWDFSASEQSSKLKSYLASLYHQNRQISVNNHEKFKSFADDSVAEDLIALLASTVTSSANTNQKYRKPYLKHLRRAEIVYEAVVILRANLHQSIRVDALAKELNVSKRSLCYGFKEMFGIGPIRFLKIERLQHIRQALKAANPKISKVGIIAEQFGIYSPGHFAKDYRQMFGETPSETLKRQP